MFHLCFVHLIMPQKKDLNKKLKTEEKVSLKNIVVKIKSIAKFFGIDPTGVDGLAYQKKVRSEWG